MSTDVDKQQTETVKVHMFHHWITACQCQSKEAFRCLFLKQKKKKQKEKKENYCKFTCSSYGLSVSIKRRLLLTFVQERKRPVNKLSLISQDIIHLDKLALRCFFIFLIFIKLDSDMNYVRMTF